ncbi:isochorismate synthase [Mariniphaga anaerophila]|uniref:isochorismate synthase n=1 Tax=Mariniphaga anaerophila TaxID=1484053 RepID=A0A1M5CUW8_9BACT|nr:isochorismate synthase [Mariniphaga anaerophila]SHF58182.1 isochorismate synthase [Mariniphaga anaerophila]
MTESKDFASFIDKLLSKNCPFALWAVPGSNIPEILISCNEELVYPAQFNKLNGQEGFIFAPYHIEENTPLVLLKPGIYKKGVEDIMGIGLGQIQNEEKYEEPGEHSFVISQPEYLTDIAETIAEIKRTKLAKVIVSRLIPFQRQQESLGEVFLQLHRQTPKAFVYLVNLPKAGLWMGATPEILLKSEGKTLETVSLAGTQSRRNDGDYMWHTKEIEEQAFVSRYLLDVFYKFNIHPYYTQGPETLESGKVAHLSTSFRFAAKKLAFNLGDFIAELHPTPAVCGYPKSKAAKFISQVEKHNRRYYTGYLGPWRLNGNVGLFVNLRCMEILPQQYVLYSGGGITARSVPEDEWEETNKKATTLLSAIEAVQNR